MEKVVIITGGNRGIGRGLAKEYHKNGYRVISIARSYIEKFYSVEQYQCDLSKPELIESVMTEIFSQLDQDTTKQLTLINNAGDIGPVDTLENIDTESIEYVIKLNLTSPLILNSLFIKFSKGWECKKKIINISSGAAINPYESWALYCSSKAGIDMMTKVLSKEQKELKNGVSVISVYPGVVDTEMQSRARNTPKEKFKTVQRFIDFYEKGELYTPEYVAEKIYKLELKGKLKNGKIIDIRNYE